MTHCHQEGCCTAVIGGFLCAFSFPPESSSFCEDLEPFVAMIKLMGEGRVDLIIKFIPLSFSFRFDMVGNPNRNEVVMYDVSWVGNEPLEAISSFVSYGVAEIPYSSIGR
jgi:hypothetical protein